MFLRSDFINMFLMCVCVFLSCRINDRSCCCVKWLYACEFARVYVCMANMWNFFFTAKRDNIEQDLLVPQLRVFNVPFLSNGQFHLSDLRNFFCCFICSLYLSTANTGLQGMLYNYNKILKCHIEMYSSSTFKVF